MYIGIDWGGTKIEVAVLDENGAVLLRRRVASPRDDYLAGVKVAVDLVREAEKELDIRGSVGVGIPGSISPFSGQVQNANSSWLIGRRLDRDLAAALGRDIRIENDANCLALSEAVDGAGAGHQVVFAAILGTGCGAGVAIGARPLTGRHRIAGEWGHNPLPAATQQDLPSPRCYCGRSGCLETYVSGTGFARDYLDVNNVQLNSIQIIDAMRRDEGAAMAAYQRYVDRLARGLGAVVNIIDPDVIVLGGGMSNIDELYADLPTVTAQHVFCDTFVTPILRSIHGDSSGVRGAAWLWRDD